MRSTTMMSRAILGLVGCLAATTAQAAVPGITGPAFALVASADYTSQPDGAAIYTWGYGCNGTPGGFAPFAGNCPSMQLPGPTLIVTEGDNVTVTLKNNLPAAAGNTSIVFAGFKVAATGGVNGLLTKEAANGGGTVTYTFVADRPGTFSYYSGTMPDLQIEMGMFGALIVRPKTAPPCAQKRSSRDPSTAVLAPAAYNHVSSCYDREYIFQLSEMDSRIHDAALAQVNACTTGPCPPIAAVIEPYHPNYFLINGRSMPDDMDANYSPAYPRQPYNANPHMHPGELVLMRIIGQGRWQHPFHFHGNHARVLARDGNLILSTDGKSLAGPLLFTTPTVPGQSQDQIFTWTGKNLNWDVYNHKKGDGSTCTPDASGYYTADPAALNYGEWCADHGKPIPVTPPDPTIVAIGQWYAGTPYLGIQNSGNFTTTNEPPGTLNQNPQSGYAYMWHSHNEREITTNNVFPGGAMSMLLIDPYVWLIDETQ